MARGSRGRSRWRESATSSGGLRRRGSTSPTAWRRPSPMGSAWSKQTMAARLLDVSARLGEASEHGNGNDAATAASAVRACVKSGARKEGIDARVRPEGCGVALILPWSRRMANACASGTWTRAQKPRHGLCLSWREVEEKAWRAGPGRTVVTQGPATQ